MGGVGWLRSIRDVVCWFSGGRDSAVACYVAKKVAESRGWGFRLVHIDTRTPRPRDVDEYVRAYAAFLGAELTVIRPQLSFKEYAARYSYWPSITRPNMRWCYYHLKREPIIRFLRSDARARAALHVFGIRRGESLFREREYDSPFGVKCYEEGLCVRFWLPLLYLSSSAVDALLRRFNIPRSPVWDRLGTSGECQCLAGTPYSTLVRLRIHYPEVVRELVEIDDVIQSRRRSGPSYPHPLIDKRMTLRQWFETFRPPTTLDNFFAYAGNACQGSCVL